jgi:eukaryotic-like serine/threonine-protein kinase
LAPTELPEIIGGKYRILSRLGAGAMGTVYAVEHVLTGERLALKLMAFRQADSREAVERFKREARASAKIKSQHVVRVIDADVADELDGRPYLVMDLLEGQDLEELTETTPQQPATVVEWLSQVARALDKAHRIGIIHRDLKPENIFLCEREDGSPFIKIVDFGIAKLTAESAGTTHTGQILGTPMYMAPEQARGDDTISPALDLYALGLIAYRLLNGQPYWTATTVVGIISQILQTPMVSPSDRGCGIGPAFDTWFLRACNPDPHRRFSSASEMIEDLEIVLGLPSTKCARASDDASVPTVQRAQTVSSPDAAPAAAPPARKSGQSSTLRSGPTLPSFGNEHDPYNTSGAPMVSAVDDRSSGLSWRTRRTVIALGAAAAVALLVFVLVGTRRGERAARATPVLEVAPAAPAAAAMIAAPPVHEPDRAAIAAPSPSASAAPTPAVSAKPVAVQPKAKNRAPDAGRPRGSFVYDPLADQK